MTKFAFLCLSGLGLAARMFAAEAIADPADKTNRVDTPLVRLFKTYFAKDQNFFSQD